MPSTRDYSPDFVAFLEDHPELDQLSEKMIDDLIDDREAYERAKTLGWFPGTVYSTDGDDDA